MLAVRAKLQMFEGFFTLGVNKPPFCTVIRLNSGIMKYEPSVASERQSPGEDIEISALRRGVTSVTEKFVRNNVGWMLVVARRILGDEGHANDCVQDAFSSIFKNLDSFRGESSLRTWMHRIVVNQALMSLRARKRLKEALIDDLLPIFDENGLAVAWKTAGLISKRRNRYWRSRRRKRP